jgi:hypothetical protein
MWNALIFTAVKAMQHPEALSSEGLGQPRTDIQSLPFGDQLAALPDTSADQTADDATPLHFIGKERNTESGNDYF